MPRPTFENVAAYIAAAPESVRPALKKVRTILKRALPKATEEISYQIPTYKIDGAMVIYFAGYAKHYALYPVTKGLLTAMGPELKGRLFNKATIRFEVDEVPVGFITKIAKTRAREVAKSATPKKKRSRS